MIENISNLIVTAVTIIGAITAALIGGLTIWTFRDIRSRSRDVLVQILATVMVGVIPIAGILVYFMLRPRETLAEAYVRALEEESLLASIEHQEFCPSCGRRVDDDMCYCPACHTKLRNSCPNCGHAVHLSWDLCPYCGVTLQPEMPVIKKPAQQHTHQPPKPVSTQIPQTPIRTANNTLPAASKGTASAGAVSGMLDRIGGAIEGLVDRISSRGANENQELQTPVDNRPRQATPPPPVRRSTPQSFSRPPASTSADGNTEGAANGKTPTSPIKPLISRDEPLE